MGFSIGAVFLFSVYEWVNKLSNLITRHEESFFIVKENILIQMLPSGGCDDNETYTVNQRCIINE